MIEQAIRPAGVEAQHPILNRLQTDAVDLCRNMPPTAVVNHRQRQQPPNLVRVPAQTRQPPNHCPVKIIPSLDLRVLTGNRKRISGVIIDCLLLAVSRRTALRSLSLT